MYGGADVSLGPTHENHPKNPKSPYALQKSIIEDYLTQYSELYGLDSELREPGGAQTRFEIPGTPCLFILRNGLMAGRITYPDYHWLDGIIRILSGD